MVYTPQSSHADQRRTQQNPPILYLVVPCYNEQEVIMTTIRALTEMLQSLMQDRLVSDRSRLLFVDDGSRDSTWLLISLEGSKNKAVTGLKLARNAGHQKALLAGLMYAREASDCVISLDADLQDDVQAIREFVKHYHSGSDIVYGVRSNRSTDHWLKRWSAEQYYNWMKRLGVPLVYNHADYRLMSRKALDYLSQYREINLFLRGIVPLLGLRTSEVKYVRQERAAGQSKYPLRKMLSFAWEGLTSFTIKPMRLVSMLGMLGIGSSLLVALYVLLSNWLHHTESGWSSLMISLWFMGSLQLLGLGVVGEYIGKIYAEVKQRPLYLIDEVLHEPIEAIIQEGYEKEA